MSKTLSTERKVRSARDWRIIFFLAGHIPANVNAETWISKGTFGEQRAVSDKNEGYNPQNHSIKYLALQDYSGDESQDAPQEEVDASAATNNDRKNQSNWLRKEIQLCRIKNKKYSKLRDDIICEIEIHYFNYIEKSFDKNLALQKDIRDAQTTRKDISIVLIHWRQKLANLQLLNIISDILRKISGTYEYIYRKIQGRISDHRGERCYPKGLPQNNSQYYGEPGLIDYQLLPSIDNWKEYEAPEDRPQYNELLKEGKLQFKQLVKLLDPFYDQFSKLHNPNQVFPIRDFSNWVMLLYGLYEEEVNESSFTIFNQDEQNTGSIFDRLGVSSSSHEEAMRHEKINTILDCGDLSLDQTLRRLKLLPYLDDDHTHFILETCIRVNDRLTRQPVRRISKRELLTLEARGVTKGITLAAILGCSSSNITAAREQIVNCIYEELECLRVERRAMRDDSNHDVCESPNIDKHYAPSRITYNDIELVAVLFQYMPCSEISAAVVKNFAPFAVKMNITL